MSYFPNLLTPTTEFVRLCRSQIEILIQTLKADGCAVYLTQEWDNHRGA